MALKNRNISCNILITKNLSKILINFFYNNFFFQLCEINIEIFNLSKIVIENLNERHNHNNFEQSTQIPIEESLIATKITEAI